MSDDLVRQATGPIEEWCKQSLALIKALEAENAALSEACAKWAEVSQGNYQRAKGAEAERDGLRDALAKADALAEAVRLGDNEIDPNVYAAQVAYREARKLDA